MVGIDSQNTTLTFDRSGLTPGVAFEPLANPQHAVFHLTQGYALTRDADVILRPICREFAGDLSVTTSLTNRAPNCLLRDRLIR